MSPQYCCEQLMRKSLEIARKQASNHGGSVREEGSLPGLNTLAVKVGQMSTAE